MKGSGPGGGGAGNGIANGLEFEMNEGAGWQVDPQKLPKEGTPPRLGNAHGDGMNGAEFQRGGKPGQKGYGGGKHGFACAFDFDFLEPIILSFFLFFLDLCYLNQLLNLVKTR